MIVHATAANAKYISKYEESISAKMPSLAFDGTASLRKQRCLLG